MRVVFDTNTVISALLFSKGQLSWLRAHWRGGQVTPLVSNSTVAEVIRVLGYSKFQLSSEEIELLLADFLPFAETVAVEHAAKAPLCRDPDDQIFIDLAMHGQANILVTGDNDLLSMELGLEWTIETPADYKSRWLDHERPT
jgi:uncharacterized protein